MRKSKWFCIGRLKRTKRLERDWLAHEVRASGKVDTFRVLALITKTSIVVYNLEFKKPFRQFDCIHVNVKHSECGLNLDRDITS